MLCEAHAVSITILVDKEKPADFTFCIKRLRTSLQIAHVIQPLPTAQVILHLKSGASAYFPHFKLLCFCIRQEVRCLEWRTTALEPSQLKQVYSNYKRSIRGEIVQLFSASESNNLGQVKAIIKLK